MDAREGKRDRTDHHRIIAPHHLLPPDAVQGAVAVQLLELLLQGRDLPADDALVALQLRLPRAPEPHAARGAPARRLPLQMGPEARQARQPVHHQGQLHLVGRWLEAASGLMWLV